MNLQPLMCCCEMATNKLPYFWQLYVNIILYLICNYNNQALFFNALIFSRSLSGDDENRGLHTRHEHLPLDLADINAGKRMLDLYILA